VIRTNVDAFSLNDLPGPTDDGRRPGAARLLADRLLQVGRTIIRVGHRLASALLMFRSGRIAPAHIGASVFGMPAHVGARAVGSQPRLQTLAPLGSRPSDPPVVTSSAVPETGRARPLGPEGRSRSPRRESRVPPAHPDCTHRRPDVFLDRHEEAAHIGVSAVGSAEYARGRLAISSAHIGASAFESPAHVGALPLRSLSRRHTLARLRAASVAARRLNRAFTCTSSIRGRRDYGS
jgi:hypothetical protein